VASVTRANFEGGSTLEVTNRSGKITITGEPRDDIEIDGGTVSTESGRIRVERRSGRVTVRCPAGTDVIAGTDSGSVRLLGDLGESRVTTGSGNISVERVASLDARTGSGRIDVELCTDECRARTGSGSLRVERSRSADLATESGSVVAAAVEGASVRTASGSVTLGLEAPGDVRIEAHSGSITVTVPPGSRPETRLRAGGSVRCDCEVGSDFRLDLHAGSGSITVTER
jgi:DUF4097 and DUF4098 domain-containing protein YvlB